MSIKCAKEQHYTLPKKPNKQVKVKQVFVFAIEKKSVLCVEILCHITKNKISPG